jgi:hypothetical protein
MNKYILIFITTLTFVNCTNKGEDSIRLIPKNYTGPVLIVFNQDDGEPKEYEEGKRLYRISKEGILKTQFSPNYGIQKHQFFYIDSLGNREEIPFVFVEDKDSLINVRDKTGLFAFGEAAVGKGSGYDPEKGEFTIPDTREFYIGNLFNIEESIRNKIWFSNRNLKQFRVYLK